MKLLNLLKLRKIKVTKLFISGVVYRIHVILIQSIFFYVLTREWKWAIGTSVTWNIINTCLYYNYHYFFARLVKLGKE